MRYVEPYMALVPLICSYTDSQKYVDDETAIREAFATLSAQAGGATSALSSTQAPPTTATTSTLPQPEAKTKSKWDFAKKALRIALALPGEDQWQLKSYSRSHPPQRAPPALPLMPAAELSGEPRRRPSLLNRIHGRRASVSPGNTERTGSRGLGSSSQRREAMKSTLAGSQSTTWPRQRTEDYANLIRNVHKQQMQNFG